MPAPTLAAQGDHAAVTTGSVTPVLPAHQTNDILVVSVNVYVPVTTLSADQIPTPSGWALVRAQHAFNTPVSDGWHALFWKRAASSSEANPVFTRGNWDDGPDSSYAARAYVVRNCVTTGDPWDSTAHNFPAPTVNNPSVPPLSASGSQRTAIHFYSSMDDNAVGTISGWTSGTATTSNVGTDSGFQTHRKENISADTSQETPAGGSNVAQGNHGYFGVMFTPAPTVTYTKAGQGTTVHTAGGVVNRQNIDKSGLAVMGVAALVKTGRSQMVASGSGADATTTADTGRGVAVAVASGSAVSSNAGITHTKSGLAVMGEATRTFAKAGAATAAFVGAGRDSVLFTEAAGGAGGMAMPVGVFTLAFPLGFEASGTYVRQFNRVGTGTSPFSASGELVYEPLLPGNTYNREGAGVSAFRASGTDEQTFIEAGAGRSTFTASGPGGLAITHVTSTWQSTYLTHAHSQASWVSTYEFAGRDIAWTSTYGTGAHLSVTWASSYQTAAHITTTWRSLYSVGEAAPPKYPPMVLVRGKPRISIGGGLYV